MFKLTYVTFWWKAPLLNLLTSLLGVSLFKNKNDRNFFFIRNFFHEKNN